MITGSKFDNPTATSRLSVTLHIIVGAEGNSLSPQSRPAWLFLIESSTAATISPQRVWVVPGTMRNMALDRSKTRATSGVARLSAW